ncbi:MAG: hypothetical protein HOP19_14875 [Acidobacteria bacterium]|nr:hypothetical protein [Acidobacteriota bacterium]
MQTPSHEKFCDIVMKGGITSGIVYPTAVAKLAEHWSFKNIGGTSAGAIAAAATAAAQYGKRTTGKDSFAELAAISTYLAQSDVRGETRLHALFQPQAATRKAYAVTLALLERSKFGAALTLLRHDWLWALIGALPGLVLIAKSWLVTDMAFTIYATLLGLVVAFIGAVGLAGLRLVRQAQRALPANGYGFCKGFAPNRQSELTNWLYALLNRLADLPENEPLTFGHLWGDDENDRTINLEMMTTNLTFGRPHRLPFEQGGYFYDPTEFAQLFPAPVIEWMARHSEPAKAEYCAPHLRTLPAAQDLPVIVATRMSLSFPVLLSAVPLHVVDRSRRGDAPVIERCWFSDGGICSNFPVHFFDGVLPTRPSFAVNLKPFHPDFPAQPVYMPTSNRGGLLSGFNAIVSTGDFLKSVVGAMQNWNDNMQLPLPGYRDRIVHICLDEATEGGLNLNMSDAVIRKVAARGELAAAELIQRYAMNAALETNWDNHRWVRFRSTLAQLETLLQEFHAAYEHDPTYAAMLAREDDAPPNSYRWKTEKQFKFAETLIEELLTVARKLQDPATPSLQDGAPNPMPELRVRPRL